MEKINFKIISPTKEEILEVQWIEVQSPIGKFLIGPDHEAMISCLKDRGTMTLKLLNGKEQKIETYGGIFKIEKNQAIAITEN